MYVPSQRGWLDTFSVPVYLRVLGTKRLWDGDVGKILHSHALIKAFVAVATTIVSPLRPDVRRLCA
jgi:hypothetical protein